MIRNNGSSKYNIKFDYDAQNNRIAKHVYTNSNTWVRSEYYIRDAQGNILSTYEQTIEQSNMSFTQTEKHIYGSSMHGIEKTSIEMIGAPPVNTITTNRILGNKNYYGSNHLSNTLVVFSDYKIPVDTDNNTVVDGYIPDVISANDYAPFGARLAERTFYKNKTINSFNGKREDSELDGMQDYGMRPYNPMEREFSTVDPLTKEYPELTPYQFAGNTPIQAIDLDGLEPAYVNDMGYNVAGSDHTYNGNPAFKPKIIIPNAPSLAEQVFPTQNQNMSLGVSVSVGYKGLSQDIFSKDLSLSENRKSSVRAVEDVSHRDNTQNLLFLGGGTETTTKKAWITSDITDPKTGKVVAKDATFPVLVTEKNTSMQIGPYSLEAREVSVNGKREVFQYRQGVEVSKGFEIGGKKGKAAVGVEGGIGVKTDWKNVEEKK